MAVRNKTNNRLVLYRTCHICGKSIRTQADTPWVRQLPNVDGKKQKTCYFCSQTCFQKSYIHKGWYDGKAEQRRIEKEKKRDVTEKNRRYREAHREELNKKRMEKYWENHDEELKNNKFYKEKRKIIAKENK